MIGVFGAFSIAMLFLYPDLSLATSHGKVTTKEDEFTGTKSVVLDGLDLGSQLRAVAFALPGGTVVRLQITAWNTEWAYLKCHSLDWQLDGRPQPGPPTSHDGDVNSSPSGGVYEYISQNIPFKLFRRIAQASTVKARLCNHVLEFTPQQISSLRVFADTVGIEK